MAKEVKDTIFQSWLDLAEAFQREVGSALKEIHKKKQEVEDIKTAFLNELHNGQYIWDPECITISAPTIVIGNVAKNGDLKSATGKVIIKGANVEVDGVGSTGKINLSAPVIEQKAIDTGIDGQEEVVYGTSRIVSQARSIVLDSKNPTPVVGKEAFFLGPDTSTNGIHLSSEESISVSATLSKENKADMLEARQNKLENEWDSLTHGPGDTLDSLKNDLGELISEMNKSLDKDKDLIADRDLTRTNAIAIDELNRILKTEVPQFYALMNKYVEKISRLIEVERQMKCIEEEKKARTQTCNDTVFKKMSTNTSLVLQSENIQLHSVDGDGKWRTNPESGIDIRGNDIKLRSLVDKEALADSDAKSRITLQSRNVKITTANLKNPVFDADTEELTSGEFPLEGNVTIQSKTLDINSVDYKQTEKNKFEETALTPGSEVNIRSEKVKVKTVNEEGKSVGKFSVNSQRISMKATDIKEYKKEMNFDNQGNLKHPKLHSKEVAKDSAMLLLAEQMNVGYKNENMISDKIFVVSKTKSLLHSNTNTLVTMGANQTGSAGVEFKDDNVRLLATKGKTAIKGKNGVAVVGDVTFGGKMKAGDIECNNLNASTSVKAPNIADGIKVNTPEQPMTETADNVGAEEAKE